MKKRFLAVLLTLCMVLSLLPVSAFAAPGGSEYEIGDTFETTAPDQKPPENIPDGTEWVGPDAERGDLICKEEEHAHSLDSCYSHDCVHEHDDDCYPTQWVKCTKEDNRTIMVASGSIKVILSAHFTTLGASITHGDTK